MKKKKIPSFTKKQLAIAVVAGILAPVAIWAASQQFGAPSAALNCESGGGCTITINGGSYSAPEEQLFGAGIDDTTQWTAGRFTSDLSVGGNLTVSGTTMISGTTTFSGNVVGVPMALSVTMNSAATTTACTSLNSSGVTRTVVAVNVVDRGTAASLGAVAWQAGTSTLNGANGSSAVVFTKGIDSTITRTLGDVITTTSTPQLSAYYIWKSGEYFNFISGTTTNAGTCRIEYY